VIEASQGLKSRTLTKGEAADEAHEGDPHFWLDPNNAIVYVESIRDGLAEIDPAHGEVFRRNSDAYIAQLKELDAWIAGQVDRVPPERRLLITNHESLGYFADRYGFRIVGTIIPSVTTGSSPSAQQLAKLITQIRETQAPAIFLETGTNPQLAEQISGETGVRVITGLYTHSVSQDVAPSYIEMMRHNTNVIVEALR
jgi:manganese/iron transport system substrate-binding protein